ncbi:MAG: hypothetical protein ACTSQ4_09795 [Candidatus Heimdallarchaeaceae archaeon]
MKNIDFYPRHGEKTKKIQGIVEMLEKLPTKVEIGSFVPQQLSQITEF